jgi:hypothetical protein
MAAPVPPPAAHPKRFSKIRVVPALCSPFVDPNQASALQEPCLWSSMPAVAKPSLAHRDVCLGGRRRHRLMNHVAAAPYCFDIVIVAHRLGELFAQLTDENINDLWARPFRHRG